MDKYSIVQEKLGEGGEKKVKDECPYRKWQMFSGQRAQHRQVTNVKNLSEILRLCLGCFREIHPGVWNANDKSVISHKDTWLYLLQRLPRTRRSSWNTVAKWLCNMSPWWFI